MKSFLLFTLFLFSSLTSIAANQGAKKYFRPCYDEDSDYLQTEIVIQKNIWTITYTAFEERNCATPYIQYEVKYQTTETQPNIDMTALEVSYTANSELVSEVLNTIKYCGFTDWKPQEKKIVTGKLCDEFQTPKANEVLYSIFATLNQENELYIGMPQGNYNGKNPELRHQNLDPRGFHMISL